MRIKNLIFILLLIILIIISFYIFISYKNSKTNNLSEYQEYQNNILEQYPYYEPDGYTYKETMTSLLAEKDSELKTLYNKIQESKSETTELENYDDSTWVQNPTTNSEVKEEVENLYKVFPEYRENICKLRTEYWKGGSGNLPYLLICEMYETDRYINELNSYLR